MVQTWTFAPKTKPAPKRFGPKIGEAKPPPSISGSRNNASLEMDEVAQLQAVADRRSPETIRKPTRLLDVDSSKKQVGGRR
jgi:hypothetical protein